LTRGDASGKLNSRLSAAGGFRIVSIARRHPLVLSLLLGLVAAGADGCRSAAPAVTPSAAAAPAPPATSTPPTTVAVPAEAPAGPPPTPLLDARGSGEGTETSPEADTAEGEGSGPDQVQKEALDLCQAATALLRQGEREKAIRAVDQAYERMLLLPENGDGAYLQAKDDIRQLIAGLLRQAYQKTLTPPSPSWDLGVPIVDNEHVRREIKSFTTVERDLFLEAYQRSGRYRPMILAKLEAAQLPSQLSWLPLVESWFKVRALSRAQAVGLWQFIASTGLRYGVTRDVWVDERMDPEKSTDAAIGYLTYLHGFFGDWPKALAAYNCGEARVLRLQGRTKEQYQDFWDLYEQLPLETRRYVPRFIAALEIVQNPARYGMTLPAPQAPLANVATVPTGRSVSLSALEQALGLAKDTLGELNPELRSGATPAHAYTLRVPAEQLAAAPASIAQLPEWKPPRPVFITHRVRSGETLGSIARQYGTTAGAIQRLNGLRSARLLRVGQRLRIPLSARGR
jgi:membrane-bound lytic murein transglycosylase D